MEHDEHPVDAIDKVRSLCGESAEVRGSYGGLEIRVVDDAAFPFADVLHALVDYGQDIWVKESKDRLVIRSKPPTF